MRLIQPYKSSEPGEKYDRLTLIIDKLKQNELLNKWDINLNTKMAQVKAS